LANKKGRAEAHVSKIERELLSRESRYGKRYKWVALSNTTLGVLMAAIDGSIVLISLPAIFNGLGINPLDPSNASYLLWLLLGYTVILSATVVTIGKLSDMFGRVRLYNLGFLVFTVGSILVYLSSLFVHGTSGALSLIVFRLVQGLGGGFLFANSAAIITDAFPHNERGRAMGINQIAGVGGSLLGMIIGGILAATDWHLIFLISVPVGIAGTIWAYLALHELAVVKEKQRIDIPGNVTFALAVTSLLIGLTLALSPYGKSAMGWSNPVVIGLFTAGIMLLALFIYIEMKVAQPMLHLRLFRIRAFAAGMLSLLLAGIARGGLQLLLVIWLQGIWLPLHGISFANTPFQAAIAMLPMGIGFLIAGPLSGYLSDKYGARTFTVFGMCVNAVAFLALAALPANFSYPVFMVIIFFAGAGQGIFASPNLAAIMSSVPPQNRGMTGGMVATFFNVSYAISLALFFSLLSSGLISAGLSAYISHGLGSEGLSSGTVNYISSISPTAAIFAAMLGYNPIAHLLPAQILSSMPPSTYRIIIGEHFFPSLLSQPFKASMSTIFYLSAFLAIIAALVSAMRGPKYLHEVGSAAIGSPGH
jgi:MFS family permease